MKLARSFAKSILPKSTFEKITAIRSRRHQLNFLERRGLLLAASKFIEQNGTIVKYGPFAGMIYPLRSALARHSIPKLLGTYEQELHDVLEKVTTRSYDLIIDVGSAEGYYAVGLARKLRTRVLAFDTEPVERQYCTELAQRNEVSHLVEMKDMFNQSDIQAHSDKRILCVCDCEGFEKELFSEKTVSQTANWDLLIELHGDAAAKLTKLKWPQTVYTISQTARESNFKELEGLGDQSNLLSEYRGAPQSWLWCDSEKTYRRLELTRTIRENV